MISFLCTPPQIIQHFLPMKELICCIRRKSVNSNSVHSDSSEIGPSLLEVTKAFVFGCAYLHHWTRGTCGRGKSSNKRTDKQQSFMDRQYTSRDAQKLRGRCHDGTNKDMSRYIHNGSVARGLLTIHHHTN